MFLFSSIFRTGEAGGGIRSVAEVSLVPGFFVYLPPEVQGWIGQVQAAVLW